jgi:hypothetical protein
VWQKNAVSPASILIYRSGHGDLLTTSFPHMSRDLRGEIDNIYMDGLLHNLGFPVLVHLFPNEMDQVLSGETER